MAKVFINATGRRKTSIARVYLQKGKGKITINKKDFQEYFPTVPLQNKVKKPLEVVEAVSKYDLTVNVKGGGITGQAEATMLAIAKVLIVEIPDNRESLKSHGLLSRDSRMVERKKPGLRKARKKSQFSKR